MVSKSTLGSQAEYVVSHLECERIDLPDAVAIRTPTAPSYYFGNLLSLKYPITSKSYSQWIELFDHAFSDISGVEHYTFTWTRTDDFAAKDVKPFLEAHFEYEETHILSMKRSDCTEPSGLNEKLTYRRFETDDDWRQWLALNVAQDGGQHDKDGFVLFLEGRIRNYKNLSGRGLGEYLGAFDGTTLVGYAGLYHLEGMARFQNVHVRPDFQNQNIARSLLTKLIQRANASVNTLIIVADENHHASRLYQSLGFAISERECSVCWWPDNPANSFK